MLSVEYCIEGPSDRIEETPCLTEKTLGGCEKRYRSWYQPQNSLVEKVVYVRVEVQEELGEVWGSGMFNLIGSGD
jgi:hypothetical protein